MPTCQPPKRIVLFIASDDMNRGQQDWDIISLLVSCASLISVFNCGFHSDGFKRAAIAMGIASRFQAEEQENIKSCLLEILFFTQEGKLFLSES